MIISARKGAAVDSTYGYVKAVEYYRFNLQELTGGEDDVDFLNKVVKTGGKLPTAGYVIYTSRGLNVDLAKLCIHGFSVKYERGVAAIAVDESYCALEPSYTEPEGVYLRELCEGTATYDANELYKIKTAEDLVCFSREINDKTYFVNAKTALVSDIDINDSKSYLYAANNEKAKMYGDINGDEVVSDLKTELTTEKGFNPIGRSNTNNKYYKGTLEGNGFTISNMTINREAEDYVGIFGYSGATISNIKFDNIIVKGKQYVGGLIGYHNSGTIKENEITEVEVTGTGDRVGGAVGNRYSGTVEGLVIESGSSNKYALSGYNANAGNCTNCYYLDTFTAAYQQNTKISSAYYNNLRKYDEVLETAYDGDLNGTGWFFGYNTSGIIDLVKENYEPDITPCTGNCPSDDELETVVSTGTGACPEGDVTPPTCTFIRSYKVPTGIGAEFYCTDESGAPEVASLFNSVTNIVYSYDDILARGSIKTGKINGNTRNINSQWTTAYQLNQPEPGRCYYYQYGAKDRCGNWTTYTTKDCYYGFGN